MIKIEKISEEVHSSRTTYPRVMRNDLDNDRLVLAIGFNPHSRTINYINLYESDPSIKHSESHHFQDFEGSITIRNER